MGINRLLAGFVLPQKYPYCCIYKRLNFNVFNDKNIAWPDQVRTYDLVALMWKYFIGVGWRKLRTIFKVSNVKCQQIWPLGVKLLNFDVEKNAV